MRAAYSSGYSKDGPIALADRARRPVRYANQLPDQVERLIVAKNPIGVPARSASFASAASRSRILQSRTKDTAATRQTVRHEGITYV